MSKREFGAIEIITRSMESQNPILIIGFPGIGLVGNIASQHIIEVLKMENVGVIESRYFPPIAMLYEGLVRMPVRLYENSEHNTMVIVSDIAIPFEISNEIGRKIVDWAQTEGIREIVCIAGIETISHPQQVYSAATAPDLLERLHEVTEIFAFGTISGISGSVMTECTARGLPGICLMGESSFQAPDPRMAAEVIKVISKLYDLDIDTEQLFEHAERIESDLQKLSEQVQSATKAEGIQSRMYG